ncbi:hypothetical protein KTR10_03645 [Candidatus Kaiserbacteria bacterium]|nr:hypothetical protein [Candidatus Kaiserbacteria bacterium]
MYEETNRLMRSVVPAVIPTSRRHLDATLERCADFADEVQVDIVDGVFAPESSWPYNQTESVETLLQNLNFHELPTELDLMIQNPEETMDLWMQTGAKKIVVHVESTKKLSDIIEDSAPRAFHLGLSLNNDTDVHVLEDIDMEHVDYIQLMGIKDIGAQGQPFDERVIKRIEYIHNTYPRLPISIDGSVNKTTIVALARAGATRFVAGSAILKSDNWEDAYKDLKVLANRDTL